MTLWMVMIFGGLLTFLTRLSFILIIGQHAVPPFLRRGLRFVPPAVLTAIIFPELLIKQGHLDLSVTNERLVAGVIAAIVAWRTRSAVWTIAVGMVVLWVMTHLGYN